MHTARWPKRWRPRRRRRPPRLAPGRIGARARRGCRAGARGSSRACEERAGYLAAAKALARAAELSGNGGDRGRRLVGAARARASQVRTTTPSRSRTRRVLSSTTRSFEPRSRTPSALPSFAAADRSKGSQSCSKRCARSRRSIPTRQSSCSSGRRVQPPSAAIRRRLPRFPGLSRQSSRARR